MKQQILTTLFGALAFFVTAQAQQVESLSAYAPEVFPTISQEAAFVSEENASVSVAVHGTQLQVHVLNGQGADLRVYDLVGKLKYETRIDSPDKSIRLQLSKGVYLVNVGKQTRRVSIVG